MTQQAAATATLTPRQQWRYRLGCCEFGFACQTEMRRSSRGAAGSARGVVRGAREGAQGVVDTPATRARARVNVAQRAARRGGALGGPPSKSANFDSEGARSLFEDQDTARPKHASMSKKATSKGKGREVPPTVRKIPGGGLGASNGRRLRSGTARLDAQFAAVAASDAESRDGASPAPANRRGGDARGRASRSSDDDASHGGGDGGDISWESTATMMSSTTMKRPTTAGRGA